jgi:N-acetylneuraminic acid mutarotase
MSSTSFAFTPSKALSAASTYTAKLSTEIRDSAGNAIATDHRWRFEVPEGIGAWHTVSTVGAPTNQQGHTAVWTGTEVIIWGGTVASNAQAIGSAARYNPITNSWTAMSSVGAPSPRSEHIAVWTGSEMIVWGGRSDYSRVLNDGARYNPVTDTWRPLPLAGAPSARFGATAVWTGTEVLVWGGGTTSSDSHDDARYNPATDSWRPISTAGAPNPLGRHMHTAVWTGDRMIVWGGHPFQCLSGVCLAPGGVYDPVADTWTAINGSGSPSARYSHTAVWTGSEMAIWGGRGLDATTLDSGGLYDPVAQTWRAISGPCTPSARVSHTAIWDGNEILLWGGTSAGSGGQLYLQSGAKYNPATGSWRALRATGAPSARYGHIGVWMGTSMFVWGGAGGLGNVATGGRYQP